MALLVDGDACPDLSAIKELAKKYQIEMKVFIDYAHVIMDDYFQTIMCEVGRDSVDLVLWNQIQAGDIVISQDYGLASLALAKGAEVLHVSGKIINHDNIDQLLMSRYLAAKQRRSNHHLSNPAKRSDLIREHFLKQLEKLLIMKKRF